MAGKRGMTSLRTLCDEYLVFRRSFGGEAHNDPGLLGQFIVNLAQREAPFITTMLALKFHNDPGGCATIEFARIDQSRAAANTPLG